MTAFFFIYAFLSFVLPLLFQFIHFKPSYSSLLKFIHYYYLRPSQISGQVRYFYKFFQIAFGRPALNDLECQEKSSQVLALIKSDPQKLKEAEEWVDRLFLQSIENSYQSL